MSTNVSNYCPSEEELRVGWECREEALIRMFRGVEQ